MGALMAVLSALPGVPLGARLPACLAASLNLARGALGRPDLALARALTGYRMAYLAVPEEELQVVHYACLLRDPGTLRLLLEEGAAENARDSRGRTGLHLLAARAEIGATRRADAELVADEERPRDALLGALAYLGAAGADMFEVDDGGMTPLMTACQSGNGELAAALLERVQATEGHWNATEYARAATQQTGETALHLAAENGDAPLCLRLCQLGADTRARDLGRQTPLHKAAAVGDARTLETLVDFGADVDATDAAGTTAWMIVGDFIEAAQRRPDADLGNLRRLKAVVDDMTAVALGKKQPRPRLSRGTSVSTSRNGSLHGASDAMAALRRAQDARRAQQARVKPFAPKLAGVTEEELTKRLSRVGWDDGRDSLLEE